MIPLTLPHQDTRNVSIPLFPWGARGWRRLWPALPERLLPATLFALLAMSKVQRLAGDIGDSLLAPPGSPAPDPFFLGISWAHQGLTALFLATVSAIYLLRQPLVGPRAPLPWAVVALGGAFLPTPLAFLPRSLQEPAPLLLADILMIFGVTLSWIALWSLRRCFGILPEVRGLVTWGPYRYLRHPMYAGEYLSVLGLALPALSPLSAGLFLLFCLLQFLRSQREEEALSAIFPEYLAYRQRTPALLPRLRLPRLGDQRGRAWRGPKTWGWAGMMALLSLLTCASAPPATSMEGTEAPAQRLFLANYYPWFDQATWSSGVTSDLPLEPYNSDDIQTMRRHTQQAQEAGLDGFVSAWLLPANRTDVNLQKLLGVAEGSSFTVSVSFQTNTLPDQTKGSLVAALRYLETTYGQHPNYLKHQGRPVIFFTNMPRLPLDPEETPHQAWQAIRDAADPLRQQLWIAEGLDPSYLTLFDGLYVLKIAHQDFPDDYLKLPRWGRQARRYGDDKLWIATIMPGWDDLRTHDGPGAPRDPAPPSRRDREEGAYYSRTFQAALQSDPHWLLLASFNEWIEGTQVEPSVSYHSLYLQLTRLFADTFKGG